MPEAVSRRECLRAGTGVALALAWPDTHGLAAAPKPAKPLVPAASAGGAALAWPAWQVFKQGFVGDSGQVATRDTEGPQAHSEGQSYALFFALVANEPAVFERVLQWTENNLCAGDLTARLPAWSWGKRPQGDWGVLDSNPASDADLWIAYALGEAGRLWNNRRYLALSSLLMARVLREETALLPGLGVALLPSSQGFGEGPGRWRLNPSYLPMHLMHWAAATQDDPAWAQLANTSLQIIVRSAPRGLSPDWTVYDAETGFSTYGQGRQAHGAYNAIRVYTWAGILAADAPGRRTVLTALAPMARFIQDQGYPPESIDVLTAQASGPGPSGFSAAVLPFLSALQFEAALKAQRLRLEARPLPADAYYQQVLGLFGLGWLEGRFRFSETGHLLPQWKAA